MRRKTNGVTLIELLVVMAILAIMAVMMAMVLDPIALMNKARDSQRKKDLNRVKIAFEEYNNDKGCYPGGALLNALNNKLNCGSVEIFSPWLAHWPCDPSGNAYVIIGDTTPEGIYADCSKTFKIVTKLENKNDKDIIGGWYDYSTTRFITGLPDGTTYSRQDINYGVSSGNINWFDTSLPRECGGGCNVVDSHGCGSGDGFPARCSDKDGNCYISNNCDPKCRVGCCFDGKICESLP